MQNFDKFDNPSYGGENVEFEDESIVGQAQNAIEPIKKFIPHIIGIIIVLAIAWFAYDFFIGSMVSATVTIQDTEGKLLEGSSLKIFATGSTEPLFKESGQSIYDVPLKAGNYRYEVTAPGYSVKKSSFEISAEDNTPTVQLSKDLELEVISFDQTFPNKLYAGGEARFDIQIKNSSNSSETAEIVAEDDIEGMITIGSITVPGNSTQSASVTITVPNNISIDDEKNGDEKKATVRVKYTNEKGSAEFTLYPNPAEKLSVNSASLKAKAKENENKDEATIKIKNDNYFEITDITLSIEITSATKNTPSEVEKWFQFTEIANQDNPQQITITSIPGREDVKKELQVVLPLTAKKEPDIKGNVVINAPYLSEPIKQTLTLDIREEAGYGIDISLSPRSPIDIEWDSTNGRYTDQIIDLKVKNEGQLTLRNLVFSIANNTICSIDWIILVENSIDTLNVGSTQALKVKASAPLAVRGQESSKYCNLRYRFDNPIVTGTYVEDTLTAFIEVAPQPD